MVMERESIECSETARSKMGKGVGLGVGAGIEWEVNAN